MARLKDIDNSILTKMGYKSLRRYVTPTLGGDPEFFVADKKNIILASDKFFPGKDNPLKVPSFASEPKPGENKIFFDGIQGEIAIAHNRCREYIAGNIARCMKVVMKQIGQNNHIVLQPAARVTKTVINSADPEARIFGCMPDFNAYTLTTNTEEMDATTHPFRYAGGHIHMGISSPYLKKSNSEFKMARTEEGHIKIIKTLDMFLGILSVLLDNGKGAKQRRTKYGKAGCFRPTPYGIEYRTLSCWWLKSPITVSLVYAFARIAWNLEIMGYTNIIRNKIKCDETKIRGIVDSGDRKAAKEVWESLRPYLMVWGRAHNNPIHVESVSNMDYLSQQWQIADHTVSQEEISSRLKNIANYDGTLPEYFYQDRPKSLRKGNPKLSGIAMLEYLMLVGVESVVSKNVFTEWAPVVSDDEGSLNRTNGFAELMPSKLCCREFKKDFLKFQTSLSKTL